MDSMKVEAIVKWTEPTDGKKMQKFMRQQISNGNFHISC
jgi:hypothetical protein